MKKAFTLLELVFVIIVIAIITAIAIPDSRDTKLREAAVQVLSHIKYTQHLAMVDDRYGQTFGVNNNWFISRWQIFFSADNDGNGDEVYTIYSDENLGGFANANEVAIDPMSGKLMSGNSLYGTNSISTMNLTDTYGILNPRVFTGGCAGSQRILFDHLGRPHTNNTLNVDVMTADCNITLTDTTGANVILNIQPETGYSCILDANGQCI